MPRSSSRPTRKDFTIGGARQALHARNAGGLSVLRARHQHRGARRPAAGTGARVKYVQGFFLAFTMRLSPARRVIYGVSLGVLRSSACCSCSRASASDARADAVPAVLRQHRRARRRSSPTARCGCCVGFLLMNLLVLLEVADRLSLKRDLEVAREIQQAMLPDGTWSGPGVEAFGLTKPANTVGGDFYDILPQPDGTRHRRARRRRRQGQPGGAADGAAARDAAHARRRRPAAAGAGAAAQHAGRRVTRRRRDSSRSSSRRTTRRPATCEFVNAGQTPPLLRRQNGSIERLMTRRHRARHVRGQHLRSRRAAARARRRAGDVQRRHYRSRKPRRRSRSTKPAWNARWRCIRARFQKRPRPSSARRFSTRSSGTAAISAWPTT